MLHTVTPSYYQPGTSMTRREQGRTTPFQVSVPFRYPLKMFSGSIEREHSPEIG